VRKFLDWYSARARLRRYAGWQEPYINALIGRVDGVNVSVGQLRYGARRIAAMFTTPELSAPALWALCTAQRSPDDDARWKQIRNTYKGK